MTRKLRKQSFFFDQHILEARWMHEILARLKTWNVTSAVMWQLCWKVYALFNRSFQWIFIFFVVSFFAEWVNKERRKVPTTSYANQVIKDNAYNSIEILLCVPLCCCYYDGRCFANSIIQRLDAVPFFTKISSTDCLPASWNIVDNFFGILLKLVINLSLSLKYSDIIEIYQRVIRWRWRFTFIGGKFWCLQEFEKVKGWTGGIELNKVTIEQLRKDTVFWYKLAPFQEWLASSWNYIIVSLNKFAPFWTSAGLKQTLSLCLQTCLFLS